MSIIDLKAQLEEIEARKAALHAAIEQHKAEAKTGLIASIKDHIHQHGYTLEEIVSELSPAPAKRAPRVAPGRSEKPAYPTYRLKSDARRTYVRGRIPDWLRDAISAAGMDPAKPDDRERFKVEYMEREAAA